MKRAQIVISILIAGAALAGVAPARAARSDPGPNPPTPGRRMADFSARDVSGLKILSVMATRSGNPNLLFYPPLPPIVSTTPLICIGARREFKHKVLEEVGCLVNLDAASAYRFNALTWSASATATIPTTRHTFVYEEGPKGRRLVQKEERRSSATLDLHWRGVGTPRVTPWVIANPFWCVCAGAYLSRDAEITGSIDLGGLDKKVSLGKDAMGVLRWSSP